MHFFAQNNDGTFEFNRWAPKNERETHTIVVSKYFSIILSNGHQKVMYVNHIYCIFWGYSVQTWPQSAYKVKIKIQKRVKKGQHWKAKIFFCFFFFFCSRIFRIVVPCVILFFSLLFFQFHFAVCFLFLLKFWVLSTVCISDGDT